MELDYPPILTFPTGRRERVLAALGQPDLVSSVVLYRLVVRIDV